MTILAVDTTSETGGVAIRSGGRNVGEVVVYAPDGFAHVLFPAIREALESAGLTLSEIDCYAAASGPGSFTGVRVGLSAVKGLAAASGRPAVGVSNLKALASLGNLPLRATILDARRGDVYAAVYNANLEPVLPEGVAKFSDWLQSLEGAEYEFVSSANAPFRSALEGTRFAEMPWTNTPQNLASAVCRTAENTAAQEPAMLDANYVRRSDAELFWKDQG